MSNAFLTKKALLKSNDQAEFFNSKCVLTISVGQENHEGDKFLATILAINKNFSECIIMVCDSLQRYTMQYTIAMNLNDLHKESVARGDEWITRNSDAINRLKIPYQISRWDFWLNHYKFEEKILLINHLYETDNLFKKSVDETSSKFVERKQSALIVDANTAFNLSIEYLLEECAVMLLLAEDGYQFEIYPSQRNDAMDYIYRNIISNINHKLMRAVSVKFKNLNSNHST